MNAGIQVLCRLCRRLEDYGAARRAAAGYLSLLVQRKVTQRKHTPEPPKTPALLAEAGAHPTGPPAPTCGFAHPCANRAARGYSRLRLRCSAAATGPNVKGNYNVLINYPFQYV